MHRATKAWKWPSRADVLEYSWKNMLGVINPPKQINNHGLYKVPELKNVWN